MKTNNPDKYDDQGYLKWRKIYNNCKECQKFGMNLGFPILLTQLTGRNPSVVEKETYGRYAKRFLAHYADKHQQEFESS